MIAEQQRKVSVAPMMACTDRHFRYLMRLIDRSVLLYTEMVTTWAIIHGGHDRFLQYNAEEHPVVLQLGGNIPKDMAYCADLAAKRGYDEINLNVGCPSPTVVKGQFGAELMKNPELVAACIRAIAQSTDLPISVKTRIGVDDQDSFEFLCDFVGATSAAGAQHFVIHARKAFLAGLNPKQNRSVPPLKYERVEQLKQAFPHLHITLNGGITKRAAMSEHLHQHDGVMIGRAAYDNPFLLWNSANIVRKQHTQATPHNHPVQSPTLTQRATIAMQFLDYAEAQTQKTAHNGTSQKKEGAPLYAMTRHALNLFRDCPGARAWRRAISESAKAKDNPQHALAALRHKLDSLLSGKA